MTPNLLDELEKIVALSEKATPGPWALEHERSGDVSIVNREHQGDDWDIATVHYTRPANADLIAATINFLRTHAPTLAAMAKRLEAAERDAARWRTFIRVLRTRMPGPGHGTRIKVVEVCPVFGEETEINDITAAIDAATQEGEG